MIYPDDYINKILCGDCLEFMRDIPDKSIDIVLTDFPYGNSTKYDKYCDDESSLLSLISKSVPELFRISKKVVAITCGVANIHKYPPPSWILSWVSPAGVGSSRWGFSCWQPILVYGKDPYLSNRMGRRPDTFISNSRSKKIGHPCPKPEDFWSWLLNRVSISIDDVVFDPFLGSGTTAIVCKKLNRSFIGIDISEEYCEIAKKRLSE